MEKFRLGEGHKCRSSFNNYVVIVKKRGKVVLFNDCFGYVLVRYGNVLIVLNWFAKIDFFEISRYELGTGC